MTMAHWLLDDIDWQAFDPASVDPEIVEVVKTAALVEFNGRAYAGHLARIFGDDPAFLARARQWGEEEVQHGQALARWAKLADPTWDFDAAYARFCEGFRLPAVGDASVRGSRSGELVARCIVEVGTSSHYAALGESTAEPVLQDICRRITADELRHYKMFYDHLDTWLEQERIGRGRRLIVALARIVETEDDELAFAYHCANTGADVPYDRRSANAAYARRTYGRLKRTHVDRGIAMIAKAAGLSPQARVWSWVARVFFGFVRLRFAYLERAGT